MNYKKTATILGIIISIVILSGFGWKGYCHFAKTSYVAQVEQRLGLKIINDEIFSLEDRIDRIIDRHGDYPTIDAKERLRELRRQLDQWEENKDLMLKKGG